MRANCNDCKKISYRFKKQVERCEDLSAFVEIQNDNADRYNSYLMPVHNSALNIDPVAAKYSSNPEKVDGRLIINKCFDSILGRDQRTFLIGEDIGQLGGVNLEFDGLQEKYGEERITDTGIR